MLIIYLYCDLKTVIRLVIACGLDSIALLNSTPPRTK
jgi:hypothetical protein